MSGTVSDLWRHPIKSHGREALSQITVIPGQTMPGDRVWAVAHEAAKTDGSDWAPCSNFTRVAKAPELAAISAELQDERVTLRHPDRPDLLFAPDTEQEIFLDWVKPLMPADRAAPARIVRVPGRGMTDSDFPSISLCNMASHRAVEQKLGQSLSTVRWRGNIWFDGLPLWEEFDWLGRDIRIGQAVFRIRERITRCMATTANPETGARDADTLGALSNWGHQDFGVYAEVIQGGEVRLHDEVRVL
ncbi:MULTISPECIES: MOSC domain-containing protein [unclassified Ruegeria]|uniref:MOSC domain-containing protein n=1 Tax=unclassified Ruegeria TaxID=2625375 RepID=UPI00149153A1|nr:MULTISPECIES: MOSC N-terminal beta barrel domain-containing protein [unclassified Ruegeria]NOD47267.1 MOSC domain-containing protein [Ruegeria sp. HKCCD5849]NOD51590.1 MOSC domain-containing protein [Ruegeria sp. HKCCD5851]NOD69265.1 MOSC domain-containing protein [Ruegeria sp. HKCCD7303]